MDTRFFLSVEVLEVPRRESDDLAWSFSRSCDASRFFDLLLEPDFRRDTCRFLGVDCLEELLLTVDRVDWKPSPPTGDDMRRVDNSSIVLTASIRDELESDCSKA